MNGVQQKNHRTAVERLEAETTEAVAALAARLDHLEAAMAARIEKAINDERRIREMEFAQLRRGVSASDTALASKLYAFTGRGFWSRLRWVITGR